jgi:ribose-phosphate pyrophosphokinase
LELVVVGTESDNPFAIDVAHALGQVEEVADLISLRSFANREFCPSFIPSNQNEAGFGLENKTVVIVSTASGHASRDALAMRTLIVARAARDNGAKDVILIEPDLFYSAQDRGPRLSQGEMNFNRDARDLAKFDGQAFSARLYAECLREAGVSGTVTIHNHSESVGKEFERCMDWGYHNLSPDAVFAHYIQDSDVLNVGDNGSNLVICAPDAGAAEFATSMRNALGYQNTKILEFKKERFGERSVKAQVADGSEVDVSDIDGKDVLIVDDMVRTGSTIMECCKRLREGNPRRVVFAVTHFYSSDECRAVLSRNILDEIITTNTVPTILNRDMQGRLRKKMVVLKVEKWLAHFVMDQLGMLSTLGVDDIYATDMSSKNPRWQRHWSPGS